MSSPTQDRSVREADLAEGTLEEELLDAVIDDGAWVDAEFRRIVASLVDRDHPAPGEAAAKSATLRITAAAMNAPLGHDRRRWASRFADHHARPDGTEHMDGRVRSPPSRQ